MESLLVGADHSAASRRAVEFAVERARANHWRVTIAHVINWSPYAFTTPEVNEVRSRTRAREIVLAQEQLLDPLVAWATTEGGLEGDCLDTLIRHGRPSEMLVAIAKQRGHGMIVVGRTGESQLRTAVFGSCPNRLVQHAPIPVVVIP